MTHADGRHRPEHGHPPRRQQDEPATARFYLTDSSFQSSNLTPTLRAQGVTDTNKIEQIKDFGFNAGGPIVKDKLWWWGAYGVQDIFDYTIYDTPDQTAPQQLQLQAQRPALLRQPVRGPGHLGRQGKVRRQRRVAKPEGDHQTGQVPTGAARSSSSRTSRSSATTSTCP